ncbi:MAG: phosphoribosylglycinamide formyltransferase [Hyphomonadaceae bacterium]|nr:phosphoribosylglycinamide formyltransferase [Hyphomonadaceae bacterium]
MTRLKLAILISGRGTNMEAILQAARADDYPVNPVLVLSNRPDAKGLDTARAQGLAAIAVDHKPYSKDREAFERAVQQVLLEHEIEMVVLAGFMRILTPWFVGQWAGRMINIHPSLLPKYPGLNTHQRAIDAGDAEAGCSVHWVTEGVDEGNVIAQAPVPIEAGDSADKLAARVLLEEHKLYPRAVAIAAREILSKKKPLPV